MPDKKLAEYESNRMRNTPLTGRARLPMYLLYSTGGRLGACVVVILQGIAMTIFFKLDFLENDGARDIGSYVVRKISSTFVIR